MSPVLPAIAGFFLVAGVFIAVLGSFKRVDDTSPGSSTSLWTTLVRWWKHCGRTERVLIVSGLAGGLLGAVFTGMPIMLVVVPLLVAALPLMLRTPTRHDVVTLEALDRWVRLVASSMPTGKSVPDAIRATAHQAPDLLVEPLRVLVMRLDDRWTTREALIGFAQTLGSVDADAVVAALVLAAERGGRGAVRTLAELSDAVQDRLRALREIESEREKPRIVVRQITVITLVVVGAVLVLRSGYFSPLASPIGQVVVGCVVAIYLGSLGLMRSRTRPRVRQRLFTAPGEVGHAGTA